MFFDPIQDGGDKKTLVPTTFSSSVTSPKVGISFQNSLTFSFNRFATLLSNFIAISSTSPKLLNLNQDDPSKNCFFWSNLHKIEVMFKFFHRNANYQTLVT